MGVLQDCFDQKVSEIPKHALRRVLESKLEREALNLPSKAIDALADHIISRRSDRFRWDDPDSITQDQDIQLVFDQSDLDKLDSITTHLCETLPEVVDNVSEKLGDKLLKALKRNWQLEEELQSFDIQGFCERLEECWGEGLALLRMLLTCVRELGDSTALRFKKSRLKRAAKSRFVLTHLHARACQVANEIICLMENGFADGAMARWRTLHELTIVALVIEDGGEELAERYIVHNSVDLKKQADDYEKSLVPLGHPPLKNRQRQRIDEQYLDAISRFGNEFKTDYGWAAAHLCNPRPTFQDLQRHANQSGMSADYKLANFSIHANARNIFFRISAIGEPTPVAGRCNAGLLEPGQNTAFSLLAITSALVGRNRDLDAIIETKMLIKMRDAIPKALGKADRKLRRDETALRAGKKQNNHKSQYKA